MFWTMGMYPMLIPCLPTNEDRPATLYSIMQSIVNFGKTPEERIKTSDLAKIARSTIFNFDYPLSQNVNKEEFECMILNHYMMRRINFDTVTLFNIQLNVKLNSIMPKYNKMFDMMSNWDLFNDGEKQTHTSTDNRNIENTEKRNASTENTNTTNNTLENESTTLGNNTSDNRYSNTPQNQLTDVQNGSYVSEYRYIQDTNNTTDSSNSKGNSTSNSNSTNTENNTSNTTDTNTLNETWTKTIGDKMSLYKEYQETMQNIYDMIFHELDVLFYGLE